MPPRLALLIFEVGVPQACTVAARNPSSATTTKSFMVIKGLMLYNEFKDRRTYTSRFSPSVTLRSFATTFIGVVKEFEKVWAKQVRHHVSNKLYSRNSESLVLDFYYSLQYRDLYILNTYWICMK